MDRRAFFDEQAPGWDAREGAPAADKLRRVVAEAGLARGHRVLDVATGTGVLVPFILEEVTADGLVVAVDVSQGMLARARQKTKARNVAFVAGDVHDLPVREASCDRVICNAALPHFHDRMRSLREMIRVLRPGGILIISHPIGREAVNALHRGAAGPAHGHRVPPPHMMKRLLSEVGLKDILVVDEPDFHLARGRKPEAGSRRRARRGGGNRAES